MPTAQRGPIGGVLGVCSPVASVTGTFIAKFFTGNQYLGLPSESPVRFGNYLRQRLFDRVRPGTVHLIDTARPAAEEIRHYTDLLAAEPIDIVCCGIDENGHVAFNDPPVADFEDPALVKLVVIDAVSRQQQVNDGAFSRFEDVPSTAITLTIPALMAGQHVVCVVPGRRSRPTALRPFCAVIQTPPSISTRPPTCHGPSLSGDVFCH